MNRASCSDSSRSVPSRSVKKMTYVLTALLGASAAGGAAAGAQVRPIVLARGVPPSDAMFNAGAEGDTSTVPQASPTTVALGMGPSGNKSVSPRPHSVAAKPAVAAAAVSAAASPPVTPAWGTGHAAVEGDFYSPLPDEKVMHLQVGHSLFIDTKHRLSRVYVTNPDVLNSYTSSPNQVVLTAKQPGSSNFIVWDEVGDTQVYMVSSETNVDGLSSAIKRAYPNEAIDVSGVDGRITLSGTVGTQAMAEAVGRIAAPYGKDVANQIMVSSSKVKQVRLRVRFAEVDRAKINQFGFNFFGILNGQGGNPTLAQSTTGMFPSSPSTSVGGASTTSTSSTTVAGSTVSVTNPLNFFLYNFNHNVGATIQDLENRQIMHILAEPTITAMSGEKANFLAGGEFPFPVVQGGSAGTAASVTIVFKPFGVKLDFTPLVNADGTIDLTVAPEVSALDYANAVTVSGFTIPALSTRRANTHVALRDGQSFAISGLLDQRTTDALGRTPGVASIPILGALFRSKNINHSVSELIVIVTPEIVDPLTVSPEENKLPASPVPLMNPQRFDEALPDSVKKPSAAK